jgi:hypothetical protein
VLFFARGEPVCGEVSKITAYYGLHSCFRRPQCPFVDVKSPVGVMHLSVSATASTCPPM